MRINFPYISIGDTLGVSAVAEYYYEQNKKPIYLSTKLPHLFENNDKVIILDSENDTISLQPCKIYSCNVVKNFFDQLNLKYNNNITPKIYLSKDEIEYGRQITSEFKNNKIISVCLFSSTDCRDLRYDNMLSLLKKLKYDKGYSLLLVGQTKINDDNNIFDAQLTNYNLRQIFSIINSSDLYLGVDTGLFHAASALNIPQVVFFRNCGCENNAYHNTSYLNSLTKCSDYCSNTPYLTHCEHISPKRCMDNFPLEEYFNIICREIEK